MKGRTAVVCMHHILEIWGLGSHGIGICRNEKVRSADVRKDFITVKSRQ